MRPRTFYQAVSIGENQFRHTCRDCPLAHLIKDRVAFVARKRDQAKRNSVPIQNVGNVFGLLDCFVQTFTKTLGLETNGLAIEIVLLRRARHILAHGLKRDRDDLPRKCLIQRRQPVQSEPSDNPPQGSPLHQKCEQGETRCQNANHPFYFAWNKNAFGDRQSKRERNRSAQPAPQDRHPIGTFDGRRKFHCGQKRHQPEKDNRTRDHRCNNHHADQDEILEAHIFEKAGNQKGCEDKDECPCPVCKNIPKLPQVRP